MMYFGILFVKILPGIEQHIISASNNQWSLKLRHISSSNSNNNNNNFSSLPYGLTLWVNKRCHATFIAKALEGVRQL